MSSEELKPCPFCGDTPGDDSGVLNDGGYKYGAIQCGCGAQGPDVRTDYKDWPEWKPKAVAEWNTRAQLAAIQQAKGEEVETAAWAITWARVGDTPARTEVLPANVFESPAAPRFYSYREPLGSIPAFQRIRAAMAAEVADAKSARDAYAQNAIDLQKQRDALRAELAAVKGGRK